MKKIKILIILICIVVVLLSTIIIYYFGKTHKYFYSISKKEFLIPGLKDGFTPQGICQIDHHPNIFLVCGYQKDGSESRIYIVDKNKPNDEKYVTLNILKQAYNGHAEGVANIGDFVYFANTGNVAIFKLHDILSAENNKTINAISNTKMPLNTDYLYSDGTSLYVGEFYREENYPTDISHHLKVANNKTNKAIICQFDILLTNNTPSIVTIPKKAFSAPDLTQGAIITDAKIVLSTSYSLPDSKIYFFTNTSTTKTNDSLIEINNTKIPVWFLDDNNLEKTITAPCMSEGIDLVNNKIYILFESASKKYKVFTRTRTKNVYTININ